jgi:hypothetical protein
MNIPEFRNTQRHDDAPIDDMHGDFSAGNALAGDALIIAETQQQLFHDFNIVPRFDMAAAEKTTAPYVPTWAHPYARYPEPNMGLWGELPPELFRIFMSSVPLADVAMLGRVSRSMSAILNSASSPYASLLPLVEQAWTDDIDMAHVVRMLAAIETMPLPIRPEALRTVASMLLSRPKFPPREVCLDTTWDETITRTRVAVYEKIDPKAQLQMLVDLEVAAWHAFDLLPAAVSPQRQAEGWRRMRKMPTECWPPMLDAVAFRLHHFRGLDMKAIISDDAIRLPGISDRVVVVIGESRDLWRGGRLTFEMMQARFGVTLSQYERLLRPIEARCLAALWLKDNNVFSDFWRLYPTSDRLLIELTERVALEHQLAEFLQMGEVGAPSDAAAARESGDIAALSEVASWRDRFSAFYCATESAACRSVANAMPNDIAVPSLTDAMGALVANLRSGPNLAACLTDIFSQPLGFQPVLLHRWGGAFRPNVDNAAYFPLLEQLSAWRIAAVDEFISRNEPVNAVRACVAELEALANIAGGHKEALAPTFNAATRMVFETMPSETWGALLTYIYDMWTNSGRIQWIDEDMLNLRHVTFLKNPRSELRGSAATFYAPHCKAAGPIFAELPDRASQNASKFENFCERMGIPLAVRLSAKWAVLRGIALNIPKATPHLCTFIRTALNKAEFADDESFRYVLANVRS